MKVKSIKGHSIKDFQSTLKACLVTEQGFKPTLALVFLSIKQDRKAMREILNKEGIDVVGSTSSGEFINGHQSEGEIVTMLFEIKKDYYSIVFEAIGERDLDEVASVLVKKALLKFKNPGIILCSTSFRKKVIFWMEKY